MSGGVVVLHQVSAESSGEIDSVRVDADGSFQIRLPFVPNHTSRPEIFFASAEFRGLLYFGPAVTEGVQLEWSRENVGWSRENKGEGEGKKGGLRH